MIHGRDALATHWDSVVPFVAPALPVMRAGLGWAAGSITSETGRMELPRQSAAILVLQLFAVLTLLGGTAEGRSAEAPDNVLAAVDQAAQSCKDFGGTPNTDAVLSTKDINGDGGEDWIADYSKLKCQGGLNPMCGGDGCTLQIYLWNGGTAWNLAFEEQVESFKFVKSGSSHALRVVMAGDACDRPSSKSCNFVYQLQKTAIVPTD